MSAISRFQMNAFVRATAGTWKAKFRDIGGMGANFSGANSILTNRLYSQALYNGARLERMGSPGVNCNRDPVTGWPTEAFFVRISIAISNGAGTSYDSVVPAGTYTWAIWYNTSQGATLPSFSTPSPASSGITGFTLGASYTTNGGATTVQPFTFTVAPGATVNLGVNGAVTFVDTPFDGQATTVGGPLFRAEALAEVSKNNVMRLLDFWNGGGRTDTTWSTRPPNYTGPQVAADIGSWERGFDFYLAAKAYPGSRTSKLMVNVPPFCDADYWAQLATLANSKGIGIDELEMEYGNEPWNSFIPIRFNAYLWAVVNSTQALANYLLNSNYNSSQPSALYQGPTAAIQITSMSLDTAGNVTVTLASNCSTYLDYATNQPYIVLNAPLIVSATTVSFNALGQIANTTRQVTVTSVSGNTFTYNTGISTTTASTAPGSTQMYFNVGSPLLADNLSFALASVKVKWTVRNTYLGMQSWQTVRPKATYKDRCYLNVQMPAGVQGGQDASPFEITYYKWLDGTGAWLDGFAPAFYNANSGTLAAYDDLYDATKTTSLYALLNDSTGAGTAATIDNGARGAVYLALRNGLRPISYEGGPALQYTSWSSYAVQAAVDPRMEAYVDAHVRTVLQNGVQRCMNFHSSPRVTKNGNSGNDQWQSCTYWSDSVTSTDSNYSAKKAGYNKFNDDVFYSNINGHDLCTLDVAYYQNAKEMTSTTFIQATTGVLYWGTGSNAKDRNVDWVYCNNTLTARQIFVDGTDVAATAVEVWYYPPDQSGAVQIGTVHVPAGGNGAVGTSTVGPSEALAWTPPKIGPYVIRLIIRAGQGTNTGIRRVRFV
jgi:hypothetical protein